MAAMPFEIVRNDITKMAVDAIVNTANPRPVIGSGTDSMIHAAAGPDLLTARQAIGNIAAGSAAITPAFALQARYVIHTVGPVWNGGSDGEEDVLRSCYDSSLKLAVANQCNSIAFPLISTGNYGFPKDKALQIAIFNGADRAGRTDSRTFGCLEHVRARNTSFLSQFVNSHNLNHLPDYSASSPAEVSSATAFAAA
jgi:O-acetyl-ADP-ribose deacetylase (regulator of RNase III)